MGMIFINAGIYVTAAMNVFGDLSSVSGIFGSLSFLYTPIIPLPFNLPFFGASIEGLEMIWIAMAAGTIVILNSNAINDRGVAMIVFGVIFWGSIGITWEIIAKIDLPGVIMFYSIFTLAATLIFMMTLIQMPTGGQKSYV